jgi:hypothetical protein
VFVTRLFPQLAQIVGGIPMSQGEIVRPSDLGLAASDLQKLSDRAGSFQQSDLSALRARLAELIADGEFGEASLDDESFLMVRDQFPGPYQIAVSFKDEVWRDIVRSATKVTTAGGATVGRDSLGNRMSGRAGRMLPPRGYGP